VTFLFLLPAFGAETAETPDAEEKEFTEETVFLAKIPEKSVLLTESVKTRVAEGKVAYVYESRDGFKICMNGDCGPYVDAVARGMPIVSPDGNHMAAVVQKGGKSRVFLNGHLSRGYDMVLTLVFSPDSMKLAYIAVDGDTANVYVNQEQHPSYPMVDPRQGLIFSDDSRHLAYVAGTADKKWRLVYNGEPGPAFDEIKHVTFSPDGSRLAYAAKTAGTWRLVEKESKSPEYTMIHHIAFSPDSTSLAYVAQTKKGFFMVRDGEKSNRFEAISGQPIFSPNGRRLAYSVAEKSSNGGDMGFAMRLVVDNKPGRPYDFIGAYLFSRDGEQLAYIAEKEKKKMIVLNERELETYDSVGIPVFDPRGRHLAYQAQDGGRSHMIKNGVKGPAFDTVSPPKFCPMGERMVYIGVKLLDYAVIEDDTVVGKHMWAGDLALSPDGKHLAYAAGDEGKGSGLVIDGRKGDERFFSFIKGAGLTFLDNSTVQGIAYREDEGFYLIRANIMPQ
jgi:Tol biopolymer transport system component